MLLLGCCMGHNKQCSCFCKGVGLHLCSLLGPARSKQQQPCIPQGGYPQTPAQAVSSLQLQICLQGLGSEQGVMIGLLLSGTGRQRCCMLQLLI